MKTKNNTEAPETTPESDPGFIEINEAWSSMPAGTKLVIGFPTSGHSTHTKTLFCLMALQSRHGTKLSFLTCENNPIGRARNIIVTQFLNNPEKPNWLLFIDNDMLVPFGSESWANKIWQKLGGVPLNNPNMDICSRLVSHGKPLVGGLYVGRSPTGPAQFAEAYSNLGVNRAAHSAPVDRLLPTAWVATGAMLINRNVFETMAAKFPNLCPRRANDVYKFFAMEDDEGEDMLFCKRAREAGIQPYVDMGCHCGHEGNYVFWPHNTIAVAPSNEDIAGPKEMAMIRAASQPPANTVPLIDNTAQAQAVPQPATPVMTMRPNTPILTPQQAPNTMAVPRTGPPAVAHPNVSGLGIARGRRLGDAPVDTSLHVPRVNVAPGQGQVPQQTNVEPIIVPQQEVDSMAAGIPNF